MGKSYIYIFLYELRNKHDCAVFQHLMLKKKKVHSLDLTFKSQIFYDNFNL